MSGKVLLIEDEELVGTMVRMNLESVGYQVDWARDGQQGLDLARTDSFDAILLDISLPGINGMEILSQLRTQGLATPIMMLTAQHEVSTKVKALENGADDYLAKPFDVTEMIARVGALVRRAQSDRVLPSDQMLQIGACWLNLDTRQALTNEGELTLGEKEAALLALLYRARGKALSRSDILEEVWGMDVSPSERTVDNFILRLRKLFEPDPDQPRHIVTVRGLGYRFHP